MCRWLHTQECLMCTNTAADPEAASNTTLSEDAWRNRSLLRFPDLATHKGGKKHKRNYEKGNYSAVPPLMDLLDSDRPTEAIRQEHLQGT